MTDEVFVKELRIRAYMDQIEGYPLGHPCRETFAPVVVVNRNYDGAVDREATLKNAVYHTFTDEQRRILLNRTEDWRQALNESR